MEKSKYTNPLLVVVVAQALICVFRFLHGDLFGSLNDGVAAVIGMAAVHELTALPAILYGIACSLGFVYDASSSMTKLLHAKLADLHVPRSQRAETVTVMMALAAVLSVAGAVLALRLYKHLAECEASEFIPLTATTPGTAFWPPPPSPPPPPLCSKRASGSEPKGPAPFQAIFGTPLPRPPFPPRSKKGAEVRAPSATPSEEAGSVL